MKQGLCHGSIIKLAQQSPLQCLCHNCIPKPKMIMGQLPLLADSELCPNVLQVSVVGNTMVDFTTAAICLTKPVMSETLH